MGRGRRLRVVVGSGFGGSITACRLSELYAATGTDPRSIVVLERGPRHERFQQSMHIDHLSRIYLLEQGDGAQVVVGNGVGGGSNVYLAASLRRTGRARVQGARARRRRDGERAAAHALARVAAVAVGPRRRPPRRQRRPHRGDRVRRAQGPRRARPGYRDFHVGKPITTMTYDFWVGRRSRRFDGTRFTLQEIFLSPLTNFLSDDGRAPAGDPSWWGLQKQQAISRWSSRIELLAMVEDTHDGSFYLPPPEGPAARPNEGPVAVGTFTYKLSEQSIRVREAADHAMKRIAERRGIGRFMKLTETRGAYASHPLGGCRMASDPDLGAVDHRGAVFGYEGLYCIDSSIVPTSLGVNPSLTIAALAERCAERAAREPERIYAADARRAAGQDPA